MAYVAKKSKNNLLPGAKLIIVIILLIATIFSAYSFLSRTIFNNPYAKYDQYNETSKQYGELKHEKKLEKETYYFSMYYPSFEEEALNNVVKEYHDSIELPEKSYGMKYISIDYDCEKIYDHYVSLTFHQITYDENNLETSNNSISYNYDLKNKRFLNHEDVLRRNYIALLQDKAKEIGIDEQLILRDNLDQFVLSEKQVTFYFNNDFTKFITINYKEYQDYIALCDENIPSLHMKSDVTYPKQPKVDSNKKLLAFTFDDGPRDGNTQAIMDEFEKYNGRATFFMLGSNIETNETLVKQVYDRGHEIGNHSYSHSMAISTYADENALMSKEEVSEELYKTNDAVFKASGYEIKNFRPPYGTFNNNILETSMMNIVKWDIDSLDWQTHNRNSIYEHIKQQVEIGYEVILLHDIHDETVEAVKLLLKELDAQGYQFVTISTLLANDANNYLTNFNENPHYNVVIPSQLGYPNNEDSSN